MLPVVFEKFEVVYIFFATFFSLSLPPPVYGPETTELKNKTQTTEPRQKRTQTVCA